jgi:hypothetical protein
MRRILAAGAGLTLVFVLVTLVALEGREVVVLETTDAHGVPRRTRTWIAEDGGTLWVEAANPERPFLGDLRRTDRLVLERGAARTSCRADVDDAPDGHTRIRRLLAERYGWADCWIGLLADTSRSLAVRIICS